MIIDMANPNFWYARFWNAYAEKCKHLSMLEHGAYTLLLDYYYSTGGKMEANAEQLLRVCSSRGEAEDAAVLYVVDRFFPVGEDGMRHNSRADDEIGTSSELSLKRSEAGKAGAKAKQHVQAKRKQLLEQSLSKR